MPFVAAPGVARVAINFINAQADRATNVFHVQNDTASPWLAGDIETLIDIIETWLADEWAVVAANAWQSDNITVRALDTEEGLLVTRVATHAGDGTSQPLPSQNTIAVSMRTGLSGRSRRGRMYHVGLSEASTVGSYLDPAVGVQIVDAYQALLAAIELMPANLGVLSYVEDGAPRAVPLFTPATNFVLTDIIVDSQDRRKPRPA
jgi:hypothetical protein